MAQDKKYPGFQYMISQDGPDVIRKRHAEIMAFREATAADCVMEELRDTVSHDRKRGLNSEYTLRWYTAKGWQVYMQHTGIYVGLPD